GRGLARLRLVLGRRAEAARLPGARLSARPGEAGGVGGVGVGVARVVPGVAIRSVAIPGRPVLRGTVLVVAGLPVGARAGLAVPAGLGAVLLRLPVLSVLLRAAVQRPVAVQLRRAVQVR